MNFELYYNSDYQQECASCCDNITMYNYALYKDNEITNWKKCLYCSTCIKGMIKTQWKQYIDNIKTVDCKVALNRLLEQGPPINFRDSVIKCDNEKSEVYKFYFDNQEQSAKLENSLIGEEREKWLIEHKNYIH